MFTPSKTDCITILSAADTLRDDSEMMPLNAQRLGLSRNSMEAAAIFLIERGCFLLHREDVGSYEVGRLSLQGRLRLDQLTNG